MDSAVEKRPVTPAVWGPKRRKRTKGRKSAPWYVRVLFPDGSREFKTFSAHDDDKLNEEEAHDYAAKMRADLRVVGLGAVDRNETVAEAAARFLRLQKRAKPGTRRSYETICRVHIVPAFPMRVRDVTQHHVVAFLTKLLTEGGMAEGSVFCILGVLKQLFSQAIFDRVRSDNPATDVWKRLPVSRRERRKNKKARREDVLAFSFTERDTFVATVLGSSLPAPLRAYWITMAYSGMRPGECSALGPADVRLEEGVIRIERNLAPEWYGTVEERLGSTKTDVARDFEVGAELAEFLATYLTSGHPNKRWLFPTEKGGPIPRKVVHRTFDALLVAAGLASDEKRFTPKALRHSYASHMLMKGAPFLWVAKQIGDTPETMLAQYAWAIPDDSRKWAGTLDLGRDLSGAIR